jgi:outer membrane protein assembly factor BamB
MNPIKSLVSSALVVFTLIACAHADDWPQWRGPNRNGISTETGWLTQWPPITAWTQSVGIGYSSVAVSKGRVYTLGWSSIAQEDTVYCFSAKTGAIIWSSSYSAGPVGGSGYDGPRSTPTIDGDKLYTYSHVGELNCWDTLTGSNLWTVTAATNRPMDGLCGSPLVEGDLIIVDAGGTGTAINRNEPHNIVWTGSANTGYSSPVALTWSSQRVITLLSADGVYGVNALSGATVWSYPQPTGQNCADIMPYGNNVFFCTPGMSGLLPLSGGTLSTNWSNYNIVASTHSPVLIGDYVYGFVSYQQRFKCIDVRDGTVQWHQDIAKTEGALIAADNKLILLSANGDLLVINASPAAYDAGGRAWIPVVTPDPLDEWLTLPVLSDGRIFCRSHNGVLVCLQVGAGEAPDNDTDNMADSWETLHFTQPSSCLPNADFDGDGADNYSEYVAGTHPKNSNSCLKAGIALSGGDLVVSWPTLTATGTGYDDNYRYYTLQRMQDLLTGTWEDVPGAIGLYGDGSTSVRSNTVPDSTSFYRIKVELE